MTRRFALLLCLLSGLAPFSGCSGGAGISPSTPGRFAGRYTGTLTATYDPRSPLTGTITSPLNFSVDSAGVVTLINPVPLPNDPANLTGTGTVDADGALTASVGTMSFGIRSLTGSLHIDANGSLFGNGEITVVSQSELAYGTWTAYGQRLDSGHKITRLR